MPMTVLITRGLPDRYRGFLASCMLEAAPGVYSHPQMSAGVRKRVWAVMKKWFHEQRPEGSLLMIWSDKDAPGGQGVEYLGLPPRKILDYDGLLISKLTSQTQDCTG